MQNINCQTRVSSKTSNIVATGLEDEKEYAMQKNKKKQANIQNSTYKGWAIQQKNSHDTFFYIMWSWLLSQYFIF